MYTEYKAQGNQAQLFRYIPHTDPEGTPNNHVYTTLQDPEGTPSKMCLYRIQGPEGTPAQLDIYTTHRALGELQHNYIYIPHISIVYTGYKALRELQHYYAYTACFCKLDPALVEDKLINIFVQINIMKTNFAPCQCQRNAS